MRPPRHPKIASSSATCRSRRADLANAMSRFAKHASGATCFAKQIAERFFYERLSFRATDKRKLASRACGDCRRQDGKDWQRYRNFALAFFGTEHCNPVADVLLAELHGVAATEPGVKQNVHPNPFLCADRPTLAIAVNSASAQIGKPPVFLPFGVDTPAVGSDLM